MPEETDLTAAVEALRGEFYEYRTSLGATLRSILDSVSRPAGQPDTAAEVARLLTPMLAAGKRDIVLGDEASEQATGALSLINDRLRSLDETIRALQNFRTEVVKALGSVGEEVGSRADVWLGSFDESASALRERVEQLALLIDSSTAAVQTVVRSQVERLSGPVDDLTRATQALSGLPASVKEMLGHFEAIQNVGETLEQTPAHISALAQRIVELTQTIERMPSVMSSGVAPPMDGAQLAAIAAQLEAIQNDLAASPRQTEPASDVGGTVTREDVLEIAEATAQEIIEHVGTVATADALSAAAKQIEDALAGIAVSGSAEQASARAEQATRDLARKIAVTVSGLDQIWTRLDVLDAHLTLIDQRIDRFSGARDKPAKTVQSTVAVAPPPSPPAHSPPPPTVEHPQNRKRRRFGRKPKSEPVEHATTLSLLQHPSDTHPEPKPPPIKTIFVEPLAEQTPAPKPSAPKRSAAKPKKVAASNARASKPAKSATRSASPQKARAKTAQRIAEPTQGASKPRAPRRVTKPSSEL